MFFKSHYHDSRRCSYSCKRNKSSVFCPIQILFSHTALDIRGRLLIMYDKMSLTDIRNINDNFFYIQVKVTGNKLSCIDIMRSWPMYTIHITILHRVLWWQTVVTRKGMLEITLHTPPLHVSFGVSIIKKGEKVFEALRMTN